MKSIILYAILTVGVFLFSIDTPEPKKLPNKGNIVNDSLSDARFRRNKDRDNFAEKISQTAQMQIETLAENY